MEEEVVILDDVSKAFGEIRAVRNLSLRIPPGQIYGLLGPNGAGKTTLIRLIAGLLRPDAGEVRVLGVKMPNKTILAQIGYMTQSHALYENLTVRENVAFFGAMAGRKGHSLVEEILELVDLGDRADSLVGTLSGGMKQRTSLACALVHRPRLLLLDEPTVGVDPQLRVQFWEHFRRLSAEGVTLIVSSHVMDEAGRCDRLGFMREGRLLAEGTVDEILSRTGASSLEEAFLQLAGGN